MRRQISNCKCLFRVEVVVFVVGGVDVDGVEALDCLKRLVL